MVRAFFEANAGRLERILEDAVPIFERWKWTLSEVEALDWDDFCLFADAVQELNRREAEANKPRK